MYCILVTGIPASGKSTMAKCLSEKLQIPVVSKDQIKELLFDHVGFSSRAEKVKLGDAAMEIMYYFAEQQMKLQQPFILENNFENASREGMMKLLRKYGYRAVTVTLTGDYQVLYRRFLERNSSPERHRGHVVNDRYPETEPNHPVPEISFENYTAGIIHRGMDTFTAGGPQIVVDTTHFETVDIEKILEQIRCFCL